MSQTLRPLSFSIPYKLTQSTKRASLFSPSHIISALYKYSHIALNKRNRNFSFSDA